MSKADQCKGSADRCARCHIELNPEASYDHQGEQLCGECCMEARSGKQRKTHWQYLGGSMKLGYLRHPSE